jgi:hypothetical protein
MFAAAVWPVFSEVWRFHWQGCLPVLTLLLGLAWVYRQSHRHHQRPRPAVLEIALASILAGFCPLPFIVPFFALSLVPLSYLALSGFRQGDPAWYQPQLTGIGGLLVVAFYTLVLAGVMRAIRRWNSGSWRSTIELVGAMVVLAMASLLPIYTFSLESPRFENILCLFCNAHRWGQ